LLLIIRKISLPEQLLWLLSWCIVLLSIPACNTRIEGCLDANAENFDLNAERDCDGCCTFPSMELALTQRWGDRNYTNEDTLYDIHGQPYKIQDLKYFFSTWGWKDSAGNLYTVDSVNGVCDENIFTYSPDNLIIDSRQFIYTLGSIRQFPVIDSVMFTLGLTEDYSCLDAENPGTPSGLTDQSPLWNKESSSLETMRLIVQKDLDAEIFDTLFINDRIDFQMLYDLQMERGHDTQLMLTVDYALWFKDVDIMDLSTFQSSIGIHFASGISRTP
jgi:hypothetical protein